MRLEIKTFKMGLRMRWKCGIIRLYVHLHSRYASVRDTQAEKGRSWLPVKRFKRPVMTSCASSRRYKLRFLALMRMVRPTESSDVDLLVVLPVPKSETRQREIEIRERLARPFRLHVLVHSPEDLAYRLVYNDWFLREITEKGEVLYETPNFYLKPAKKEQRAMNPLTEEWVQKAEGDYTVAQQSKQGQNPVNDVICFLAQQCVEKYLKAWLQEANIPFPRTHDLTSVIDLNCSNGSSCLGCVAGRFFKVVGTRR